MGLGNVFADLAMDRARAKINGVMPKIFDFLNHDSPGRSIGPDDWIPISFLPKMCPRALVIAHVLGIKVIDVANPDLKLAGDLGSAMHAVIQEAWGGPSGLIWGGWRCTKCASLHGCDHNTGLVTVKSSIPMPTRCQCGGDPTERRRPFTFVEPGVVSERLKVRGKIDGLLKLPSCEGEVFDIKTTGALDRPWRDPVTKAFVTLMDKPKDDHVVQVQWYMWLSGIRNGRLLYLDRGAKKFETAFVEHEVGPNDVAMENREQQIRDLREALGTRVPPSCPTSGRGQYGDCACVEVEGYWPRDGSVPGTGVTGDGGAVF